MNKTEKKNKIISEKQLKEIKKTIEKMHKSDKDNVPKFLDSLKQRFNVKCKEATSDNEFLKYM